MSRWRTLFGRLRAPAPVLVLQSEAAECGIACLAMVASFHGYQIDLGTLRRRYSPSPKGMRLVELMDIAEQLALSARAVKLNLAALDLLQLPAILHWDFNHFVVLTKVGKDSAEIYDPARGRRTLALSELSLHFTGVAMETRPMPHFQARRERRTIGFRQLLGRVTGLRRQALRIVALSLVLELFSVLAPLFMQLVIDHAVLARDTTLVLQLAQAFFLLLLAQVAISASRSWLMTYLGTHLNLRLIGNLFHHLLRLPIEFFERRHLGDIASRFDSLNTIQRTLTNGFLAAILDGAMALVTLAMMFFYSATLSCVVLAAAAIYVVLRIKLYRAYRMSTQEQIVCAARQQSQFLESVRGIQSIKLFGREQARGSTWLNSVVATFNASLRTQRVSVSFQLLNTLLFGIENIVVISAGATAVINGAMSVGMLFAFLSYKLQFVSRLGSLVDKVTDYSMLGLHRERVADIALTDAEKTDGDPAREGAFEAGIELVDVGFRYSPAEEPVLRHVNLRIAPGECVAITGPSGCGKTTLMKIMLGLLQPTEGQVLVGGVPLQRIGLKTWRRSIGSVMQDDTLFAGSIAENISFFDSDVNPGAIAEAAMMADIDGDIAKMPMGYDTLIGDMGSLLSGGQRQRLLMARALYRKPRLLFLDEATSHLDAGREQTVNRAIRALPLTRVIIAHRAETIRMADRVINFPLAADDAGQAGAAMAPAAGGAA
nr:peptidase domain-containing ABC transporter [Massilia violaceinigra]